jgi:hypothetical protein
MRPVVALLPPPPLQFWGRDDLRSLHVPCLPTPDSMRGERNRKWSFLTMVLMQEVVNGPPFPVPNALYSFSQKG